MCRYANVSSLRQIAGKTPRAVCDVLSSVTFCHSCMYDVRLFTFLCQNKKKTFLTKKKKRKVCAVGKVCVILDFFKIIIYFFYFRTEIETAAILDKGRWVGTYFFA
jgi:hypothetical protein